jgi:hypothetical protein
MIWSEPWVRGAHAMHSDRCQQQASMQSWRTDWTVLNLDWSSPTHAGRFEAPATAGDYPRGSSAYRRLAHDLLQLCYKLQRS